ncbi:DUF2207 domain-containing protein [Parasphaerochaeta coccoides]|uniref:Transmembrane signal peptide protein n=1 Tax=Parasphaerochaeta coccoides (strain ATCC BAA-1237 / DSM 17374 / SPN1) TaxID=760011 RepID=F4GKN2_PARC1|nr:DUF2207 domain-containing protein [Parasphaerochaeta coccoides]AEC01441.1 Protein of unknown function DUF2207, membrane [Parasphaerochaeta coccoides DSM 17374]
MRRFLLVLFAVCALGIAPLVADNGYNVEFLDMSIDVMDDGRFAVKESFALRFLEGRHGIYRDIPVGYGTLRATVTDISASVPLAIEKSLNYVSIRMGDENRMLKGAENFILRYVYNPYATQGDGKNQYDEFYYNLIGEGWTSDIREFSAEIYFPKPVDASRVWLTRGFWGSTSSDGISWQLSDDGMTLSVRASGFTPDQALTVRVELPEGYFDFSQVSSSGGTALLVNIVVVIIAVAAAFLVWSRWGRDDDPIVVVRFEPPEGMSPMDVGYCADGRLDARDITSMLFFWADRGYLTIEEKSKRGKKTVFTRVKKLENAPAHEKKLFDAFFACGTDGVVTIKDLEGKFGLSMEAVRSAQADYFKGEHALKKVSSSVASGLSLFLAAVPILGYSYVGGGLYIDGMLPTAGLILGGLGLLYAFINGGVIASLMRTWHMKSNRTRVFWIIFVGSMALVFAGAGVILSSFLTSQIWYISILSTVVMISGIILIVSIALATQKRSAYGQKVLEQILGYREFIDKVEVDKLKTLINDDPEFFYHVLSYAIVLGLEDTWARKFASITVEQPSWYSTSAPVHDVFFYSMLASRLNTRMTAASIPVSSNKSPSSPGSHFGGSSFGGSGFSGGGFGGGGGRSW